MRLFRRLPRHCGRCGCKLVPVYSQPKFDRDTGEPLERKIRGFQCPLAENNPYNHEFWSPGWFGWNLDLG